MEKNPLMMIFLDLVDFFGLVWSFDLPKLCIKCLRNGFAKTRSMFWPHIECEWITPWSLHEFWHVFTNELVMTLVDVLWDFELLETIYQFSLIFLSCVTLSWHHFFRTCFDSNWRSHFAYAFRQYDWGIFLWFVKPNG